MAAFMARHAEQPGHHLQRLARGEESIDIELLRDNADIGARLAGVFIDIDPPDLRCAGGLDHCPRQNIDQRRFTRAIGAEQTID